MGFRTATIGQPIQTRTKTRLGADHARSAQLLAAHRGDTTWLTEHVAGCVHPWLDGYTCAFCELPVRTDGDQRHPGYGIVEHTGSGAESDLRVLHRFCGRMAKVHLPDDGSRYGLALRRAWLGWATDQFLAGAAAGDAPHDGKTSRHFGAKHYERLGLHPGKLRDPALFQKYWTVRKMRCASHAIHYYTGH